MLAGKGSHQTLPKQTHPSTNLPLVTGKLLQFPLTHLQRDLGAVQGRRQRGGPVVPGPPLSRLTLRLLRTSNTVFEKCAPPSVFWLPLLLNPGDGPGAATS